MLFIAVSDSVFSGVAPVSRTRSNAFPIDVVNRFDIPVNFWTKLFLKIVRLGL